MTGEPERTERLQVILPMDAIAAIDEFRFRTRMPSQIRIGIGR
jgi:hypothetical protein